MGRKLYHARVAGFDEHNSPAEVEDAKVVSRNARYVLILFAVYLVIYGGFMFLNAFYPELMARPLAGVNLAIGYGMGLIAAALVLAAIYMFLCRAPSE